MSKKKTAPQLRREEFKNLFSHACNLQETGQLADALLVYDELLASFPGSPLIHYNCGLAFFDLKNYSKAESHYEKAVAGAPEDPDIHYNRGLNFRRLLRFEDAAKSFEDACKSGDTTVDILYNLALCHQDLEEFSEAARIYRIILSQRPTHQSSLNNFAYLCHKSGDVKQAKSLYGQLLKLNPKHLAAKHMLYSLTGVTPDNAPLDYVESVFDNYADDFEHSLVENLQYKTPMALYDLYCDYYHGVALTTCLDLGCGTGLAGEHFKHCCSELIGVDISQKMLDVAREKNLYNELVKNDIISFLQTKEHKYDLIVAADVFTYMGDLENVFKECCTVSKASGILLFSVEETDNINNKTFNLKQTGRFGHSVEYIETLCKQTGWTIIDHKISKLRQDKGEWIKGHLFILQQ
ncbi:MAG TPA: tetratricopeptide repeat protein [Desulfocapsa sulfexigens]|nr:tetratricopeptide repeat protein [Desulfocapsa sulfexigens]